eukprot:TRINITY_DN7668_c0_g3_i2.p1 TRINITY_DN7668_c0_g3~~TRINITY_DN7668_c0_g3_i2.p1  ORF type:complete len:260 (-),score=49.53 TRINITY_DN7668_c0_g3_i2:293-1072(-)
MQIILQNICQKELQLVIKYFQPKKQRSFPHYKIDLLPKMRKLKVHKIDFKAHVKFIESIDKKLQLINFNQFNTEKSEFLNYSKKLMDLHFENLKSNLMEKLNLIKNLEKLNIPISDVVKNIYKCSFEYIKENQINDRFLYYYKKQTNQILPGYCIHENSQISIYNEGGQLMTNYNNPELLAQLQSIGPLNKISDLTFNDYKILFNQEMKFEELYQLIYNKVTEEQKLLAEQKRQKSLEILEQTKNISVNRLFLEKVKAG